MSSDPTSNSDWKRSAELAEDSGSDEFTQRRYRKSTSLDTDKKYTNKKSRDIASYAVAELRKSMGKTQTRFAVEVLRVAVSTVARYETSQPPRGDVLLLLASISEREGLPELRDTFQRVFIGEVLAKFSEPLEVLVRSFADADSGQVLSGRCEPIKVYDTNILMHLASFVSLDPKTRAQVAPAISVLIRGFCAGIAKIIEDARLAADPNNEPWKPWRSK